jgi:hypothetical protein
LSFEDAFRTYFYANNNNLYVDSASEILATPQDIANALDKGQIIIKESLNYLIPITFNLNLPFNAIVYVMKDDASGKDSGTALYRRFIVGTTN